VKKGRVENRKAALEHDYPISGKLENWYFRFEETCTGVWEASGEDIHGRVVSRTGTTDPELTLEECIRDAEDLGKVE